MPSYANSEFLGILLQKVSASRERLVSQMHWRSHSAHFSKDLVSETGELVRFALSSALGLPEEFVTIHPVPPRATALPSTKERAKEARDVLFEQSMPIFLLTPESSPQLIKIDGGSSPPAGILVYTEGPENAQKELGRSFSVLTRAVKPTKGEYKLYGRHKEIVLDSPYALDCIEYVLDFTHKYLLKDILKICGDRLKLSEEVSGREALESALTSCQNNFCNLLDAIAGPGGIKKDHREGRYAVSIQTYLPIAHPNTYPNGLLVNYLGLPRHKADDQPQEDHQPPPKHCTLGDYDEVKLSEYIGTVLKGNPFLRAEKCGGLGAQFLCILHLFLNDAPESTLIAESSPVVKVGELLEWGDPQKTRPRASSTEAKRWRKLTESLEKEVGEHLLLLKHRTMKILSVAQEEKIKKLAKSLTLSVAQKEKIKKLEKSLASAAIAQILQEMFALVFNDRCKKILNELLDKGGPVKSLMPLCYQPVKERDAGCAGLAAASRTTLYFPRLGTSTSHYEYTGFGTKDLTEREGCPPYYLMGLIEALYVHDDDDHSALAIPLFGKGQLLGVSNVYKTDGTVFSLDEIEAAESIASGIGARLQEARDAAFVAKIARNWKDQSPMLREQEETGALDQAATNVRLLTNSKEPVDSICESAFQGFLRTQVFPRLSFVINACYDPNAAVDPTEPRLCDQQETCAECHDSWCLQTKGVLGVKMSPHNPEGEDSARISVCVPGLSGGDEARIMHHGILDVIEGAEDFLTHRTKIVSFLDYLCAALGSLPESSAQEVKPASPAFIHFKSEDSVSLKDAGTCATFLEETVGMPWAEVRDLVPDSSLNDCSPQLSAIQECWHLIQESVRSSSEFYGSLYSLWLSTDKAHHSDSDKKRSFLESLVKDAPWCEWLDPTTRQEAMKYGAFAELVGTE